MSKRLCQCNAPTCPDTKMRELLRRDWAVRVLDAFALAHEEVQPPTPVFHRYMGGSSKWALSGVVLPVLSGERFESADAARHAASLAVFRTLPAEKQAELGECP